MAAGLSPGHREPFTAPDVSARFRGFDPSPAVLWRFAVVFFKSSLEVTSSILRFAVAPGTNEVPAAMPLPDRGTLVMLIGAMRR